jgi:hypothetical protein
MIATGIVVFLSAALVLLKLPRRLMLRALRHDVAIDLSVTALVLFVHWGTFSGVMAATFAGLLTSLATSTLKRLVGYIDGDRYHPGLLNIKP